MEADASSDVVGSRRVNHSESSAERDGAEREPERLELGVAVVVCDRLGLGLREAAVDGGLLDGVDGHDVDPLLDDLRDRDVHHARVEHHHELGRREDQQGEPLAHGAALWALRPRASSPALDDRRRQAPSSGVNAKISNTMFASGSVVQRICTRPSVTREFGMAGITAKVMWRFPRRTPLDLGVS